MLRLLLDVAPQNSSDLYVSLALIATHGIPSTVVLAVVAIHGFS